MKNIYSINNVLKPFWAVALMGLAPVSLQAADRFWNPPVGGSGGSTSWNNGTNWGGTVPANDLTSDIAVFNGTTAYNFQPALDAFTVQSVNGVNIGGTSTVAMTLSAGSGTRTTSVASTSGSSTLTFSDVTGLAVGQNITGTGIAVGTFITGIAGNTVTLSRTTSGSTASGTSVTANSSLRLGSGGIVLSADTPNVANIITAPIVLGANQTWENLATNRTLQVQGSIYLDNYTLTFNGVAGSTISLNGNSGTQSVGGSGNLIIDTAGTVSFGSGSGNRQQSTFTGGVTLNNGTITLQGGNSGGGGGMAGLGTGVLTINGGAISGGGNIAGRPLANSGQVWNANWLFTGSRSVDMGVGQITLGTAAGTSRTLTVSAGTNTLTLGGAIVNGTTANSLVKEGTGILILNGASTYTGTTAVNAGTMLVNGSLGGGGDVTVASGATLGGSGSIAGNTFISGVHSPGNSPGVQTFGADLTYNSGASVQFELAANTTTQGSPTATFDQIVVGADLDFAGPTTLSLAFNPVGSTVDWSDTLWDSNQSWLVYDVAGLTTNFSNLSLALANWADGQGDLFNTELAGSSFTLRLTGSDVYLDYNAIPEPSTFAMLGLSALFLLRRKRRA